MRLGSWAQAGRKLLDLSASKADRPAFLPVAHTAAAAAGCSPQHARTFIVGRASGSCTRMRLIRSRTPSLRHRARGKLGRAATVRAQPGAQASSASHTFHTRHTMSNTLLVQLLPQPCPPPTSAACQRGMSSRRAGYAATSRSASGWASWHRPLTACRQWTADRRAPAGSDVWPAHGQRAGQSPPAPRCLRDPPEWISICDEDV